MSARTSAKHVPCGDRARLGVAIGLVVSLQLTPLHAAAASAQGGPEMESASDDATPLHLTPDMDLTWAINQARALAQGHLFDKAESLLRGVLAEDPDNVFALYELATVLSWSGEYEESIELYRRGLNLEPDNSGLHMEIARVLLWQASLTGNEDYRRAAIREFESRLQQEPTDCVAIRRIGEAYLEMGDLESARARLASALELCPDDDQSIKLQARVLCAEKKVDEAVELLSTAAARLSGDHGLRWMLADCLVRSGDLNEAEAEYRACLEDNPYDVGCLVGLGRVLMWKCKYGEAEVNFRAASLADVKAPGPYLGMGELESRRGYWRAATRFYKRALDIEPQDDLARSRCRQASWMSGPGLKLEYSHSDASNGLDQELAEAEARMSASERGVLGAGYGRSRFTDEDAPALYRNDVHVYWQQQLSDWLKGRFNYSMFDFTDNPEDSGKLQGWSADFVVMPSSAIKLYASYSRIPVSESYATLRSDYYSDVVGVGFDGRITRRTSVQGQGSMARRHGVFPVGYWDSYHETWVVLDHIRDRSEQFFGEAQISYKLLGDSGVFLRCGTSIYRSVRAGNVPYWSPRSFPQEKLSLSFAKRVGAGFRLGIEARGTHVHEGSRWGYGMSVAAAIVFKLIDIEASASVDDVGTQVPWNGRNIGAALRLH
jgi:tetratricopeptide (TPR) repeat protein